MTREEAIKSFEEIKASAQSNLGAKHAVGCDGYYRDRIELAEAALKALRSVSREQVEDELGLWVYCNDCCALGPTKDDEYDARLAWNTRAPIMSAEEMEMLDER